MVGGRNFHQSHSVTNRRTVTSSSNSASSNSPQLTTSVAVTNSTRASNSNHNLSTTNLTLDRDHETVHHHHHHQQQHQHQHQHPPPLPPHHSSSSSSLSTNNNIRSRYSKSFVNLNNNSHSNNGNELRANGETLNSVTTRQYSSTSATSNRITRSIPNHNTNSSTSSSSSSNKLDASGNGNHITVNTNNSDRWVGSVSLNSHSRLKGNSGIPKRIDQQQQSTSTLPVASQHQQSAQHEKTQLSESVPLFVDTPELRPEIFFLLREHAKTLAALNKITNRLGELEDKVEEMVKKVIKIEKVKQSQPVKNDQQLANNTVNQSTTASPANVLSDDSGGEYSRTTTGTGTDEDELLSLLNQIAKFSDTIKQQSSSALYAPLIPRSSINCNVNNSNMMESNNIYARLGPTSSTSTRSSSSTLKGRGSLSKKMLSPLGEESRCNNEIDPTMNSFSALLFDSNLDHFLDNLDIITDNSYYPPHPLHPPIDHQINLYHQQSQQQQHPHQQLQQNVYSHQHGRSLPANRLNESGYSNNQQQQSELAAETKEQQTKSSDHWAKKIIINSSSSLSSPSSDHRTNRSIPKPSPIK